MILGVTGGIASGKSLVAECFRARGVPIIDTDAIARQVVAPGHPAWQRLREVFGPAFFLPDGQLDRVAMARQVFTDSAARATLEAITHPAIFAEVDRHIAALQATPPPPPLILVIVPLLYEVGARDRFDAVLVVAAAPDQQRDRLIRFRGMTPEDADARLAAQWPIADKIAAADYVIDNSGTPADTCAHIDALLHRLLTR